MNKKSIHKLVRKNILAMHSYASARDEFKNFTDKMVFLDANENPFETGINRYPDPKQQQLKKAISELRSIHQKNIILGNGSDELLDLLFRGFCEPNNDSVVTLPPTYGMYDVLAQLNAVENREIALDINFQPDVKSILQWVDETTKIIFLCSPNNPTANVFSEESISKILRYFDGLVVIDEAYIDFSSQESWLKKISAHPNLIVLQTLSKAYGMAGIRLGILYAAEEIISILDKIKLPYNVNQLTQQKALERVSEVENIKTEIGKILKGRDFLENELIAVSFIEKVYPSETNFILVKVDDADKRYGQLIQNGIVVRNRNYQLNCENCLRITVGTVEENKKLIEIMKGL